MSSINDSEKSVVDNVLKYNGASYEMGTLELGNLSNVTTAGVLTNQYMKYNGTNFVFYITNIETE